MLMNDRSIDSLTIARLCVFAQDRCVQMLFGQIRLVLDTTIRLCIFSWYALIAGCRP